MGRKRVVVCIWWTLAVAAIFSHGPAFVQFLNPYSNTPVDFFQEWASARNFFSGRAIYTPHSLTVPEYLGADARPDKIDINAHPPTSVLLSVPFGLLDYTRALKLWNLLSLAALYFSCRMTFRELGRPLSPSPVPLSPRGRGERVRGLPMAIICLLSFPMEQHLENGQWTIFLLLLLTVVWASDRAGRDDCAGAALGLATALKLFPALLFIHFAARRQWRTVGHGLLWFAGISVITAAVLGMDTYRAYVLDALPKVAEWRSYPSNSSLPAVWAKAFDPGSKPPHVTPLLHAPLLASIGSGLSRLAVMAIVIWLSLHARTRSQRDLAFGSALLAMLLISPVTWQHYMLLLTGYLVILWQHLPDRPWPRFLFWLCVFALWMHPRFPWKAAGWLGLFDSTAELTVPHLITMSALPLYGVMVLLALGAHAQRTVKCELRHNLTRQS